MAEANPFILANIIRTKAEESPDLDVLTFVTIDRNGEFEDEIRTYRDLWENGQRLAEGLGDAAMAEGESFGLITANHPEFVESMIGASIENVIFVPIDPRTKGAKLTYMLSHADCKGAIIADYALDNLVEVLGELPELEWVWVLDSGEGTSLPEDDRFTWIGDILAKPVPDRPVKAIDPEAPMQMLYTSGTTGDPKAILAQHARFGGMAMMGEAVFGFSKDDRPYTGLSLTHANAQLITLGACIGMGLRGVISRKFTKSRLWDITRRHGCTCFNLLGGMTTAIYSEPRKDNDADNPVNRVLSAGMPGAIWEDFANRFDLKVHEFYGTAEGGMTMNPPGVGPIGSCGKPPPNLIGAILDENDNECPPGVSGQICFRNAGDEEMSVSYFKNEEASKKKTDKGWFRSGDIGHMDEDGWFYFEYRAGGGIRRNGDFINPGFVEGAIAANDMVDDIFIWGIHTESNTPGEQEVVAAIVPTDKNSFDPQAVFSFCREKLESNYVPTFIQVMDEIPKTASEKPQMRFCLEDYEADRGNIFTENRAG
jgi:crotonobetaine/carnitine-CoA ligase